MKKGGVKKIIIVGAGFAGVRCALDLLKKRPAHTQITLINNQDYFEYYPAMYRVATGSSPLQACIPLQDIFAGKDIECIKDSITSCDPHTKTLIGESGSQYVADTIILAIGSEMTYFDIEGVEELSFNFKSIHKALELRRRIIELFATHYKSETDEALLSFHFVIVGGGASGTELAGELAMFTRKLAKKYNVPESMITIDLVEAAPRILGGFSEKVSERVTSRLRSLGVNVLANRILLRSESWTIFLRDMELGAKTLVWTAGVRNNSFYKNLSEHFEFDGKGRVIVDEFLQAKGFEDIFVAGDNASTKFSGLAQTALFDGSFVAQTVLRKSQKKTIKKYQAQPVSYDVPVGPGWAVLVFKGKPFFGWVPWMMRHIIDFRFYVSILPFFKAWNAFFSGRQNILSTIPIQEKKKETSPKTS